MRDENYIEELTQKIVEEILSLIEELELDMDYGVEIFIDSEDLDEEVLRGLITRLKKRVKLIYVYPFEEPGYYKKKILWRGIDITIGIRPAIL